MTGIFKLKDYEKEVKKCPFCGHKVEVVKIQSGMGMIAVRCLNPHCGADIMFDNCEYNPAKAVLRFNRRESV
ncbi:Lar family restriction alleviation protein [uncultured Megasphaera sp.]|uniref:Lar family restriction alleviation protein n=1 Tax=uncultured Megasphaera sp. TaxID=165188 RepID=UPI00266B7E2A|nr:Lar family restriction alleviation protein [uncultured Megasphaera sp.]